MVMVSDDTIGALLWKILMLCLKINCIELLLKIGVQNIT